MKSTALEPVVVIDDDKSICKTLKLHFEALNYNVITTNSGREGMKLIESLPSAIVILDVRLPDANGIDLLKEIREKGEKYYSIIITAFPDMMSTVKAVQNGVGEYIHKPIDIVELDAVVAKANDFLSHTWKGGAKVRVPDFSDPEQQFIGNSKIIHEIFKTVGLVSMSQATVTITGESGTGKELIARAIHKNSANRDEPFVSVNCSAIVETLLESELFGHVKGAYTGAINNKAGKFFQAQGGSIFLDEIGEMSFHLQAKLLRVLQEREFEPVGGKEKIKINCRVISATNKNLKEMVKLNKFRNDLFYRLNVINIYLPPLRERREDISELTFFFIAKANREVKKNIKYITEDALNHLTMQDWPGNVRELENTITHAVVLARGNTLDINHLNATLYKDIDSPPAETQTVSPVRIRVDQNQFAPRSLKEMEKIQIDNTLHYTNWHKGKACDILGITRPRLDRKIKKYKIAKNN